MRLEQGAWENPAGTTPEEKGKWIAADPIEVTVPVDSLAPAMQTYREDRRAYKEAQYQERQANREKKVKPPAKEQAEPASVTKDVAAAQQQQGQSRPAPSQTQSKAL